MQQPQDDVPIIPYDEVDGDASRNPAGEFYDAAATASFDSLTALSFGLMLIGAGLLFLVAQINNANGAEDALIRYDNILWWLAIGAGVIMCGEILLRLLWPRYRSHVAGRLVIIFVFLAIGIAGKIGVEYAIPVVLIGAGLVVLIAWFVR